MNELADAIESGLTVTVVVTCDALAVVVRVVKVVVEVRATEVTLILVSKLIVEVVMMTVVVGIGKDRRRVALFVIVDVVDEEITAVTVVEAVAVTDVTVTALHYCSSEWRILSRPVLS